MVLGVKTRKETGKSNNNPTFRVSESDRRFFEQFGLLSQRFKERDLLNVDSKSPEPGEEEPQPESDGGCTSASCPGLTWDAVSYTNIFKFNQDLEKTEVASPGLSCLFEMFISARETLRGSFVYNRE